MYGYHDIENWQKDPTVAPIVRAAFPDYRRKKVSVKAAEAVMLQDLNWSGGTRSIYRAVALDGSQTGGDTLGHSQRHPMDNQAEGASVPVPQGFALVRGGDFCGKPSLLTIYVNPADMPRLLAQPVT